MTSDNQIGKGRKYSINCKGALISFEQPKVMGIVNLTPDSFYDGGKNSGEVQILKSVEKHLKEGATFLDFGAVSTKPNAAEVSEEEELKRLLPVLKLVLHEFKDAIISVDTFRSKVAKQAIDAGASLINDISGGDFDENMFQTIRELQVPYVMMHIQGNPQNMQVNPTYKNVLDEVQLKLSQKLQALRLLGVNDVILDPGFGFGKTVEHNYNLLKELEQFHLLNCPILVGVSRKSMINKVLKTLPENALNGTTVANTIALLNGANILRVHDVKEAVEAVKIVTELQNV